MSRKLGVIAVVITLLSTMGLLGLPYSSPLSLTYYPTVAAPGEPVVIQVQVMNTDSEPQEYWVELALNGRTYAEDLAVVDGRSVRSYAYSVTAPPQGSSISIHVRVEAGDGEVFESSRSVPPVPPQILSSFVAFSSAITSISSTSVAATSMGAFATYVSTMGVSTSPAVKTSLNLGVTISLVLIGLLIFQEVTGYTGRPVRWLTELRRRFNLFAFALLFVFLGIVSTTVVSVVLGV